MRMLSWLVDRFRWEAAERTLADDFGPQEMTGEVEQALVAFIQLEERDKGERRPSVFRQTLKTIKWQANKLGFRTLVLHSFAHLGSRESADAAFAWEFLVELAERLRKTGYEVHITPFGYTCVWTMTVRGEPIGRIWKEV